MPQQMEDSPGASEKRCGLAGGNGMIMSEQGGIYGPAGCSQSPSSSFVKGETSESRNEPRFTGIENAAWE
jgi:hypothetical protein